MRDECNWDEFFKGLCERFRKKRIMDIVEEFNKMKQNGSMQEYQLKFEELKSLMLCRNPYTIEDYFVSSFISGLSVMNLGLR